MTFETPDDTPRTNSLYMALVNEEAHHYPKWEDVQRMAEFAQQLERELSRYVGECQWISVKDRLPETIPGHGSYESYGTGPVLVLHRDRQDYPITAHAHLGECVGLGIRIPTNGASRHAWIGWYSIGRDLSNPFEMASTPDGKPFKDSGGYHKFLPSYFGAGITHWMPLPSFPSISGE